MAKYCSKECEEIGAVCDFCKFYDLNADKRGNYVENGYCNYHKEKRDLVEGCDYFICQRIEKKRIFIWTLIQLTGLGFLCSAIWFESIPFIIVGTILIISGIAKK